MGSSPAGADLRIDPLHSAAAFHSPPVDFRPKFRWWWGSPLDPKEISDEVNAMGDAGFRGGEIAFFGDWGTPTEQAGLTAALAVAHKRGMSLDETLGKAWPVTTPNTGGDQSSLNHAQEMMYGAMNLTGPGSWTVAPPQPQDHNIHVTVPAGFVPVVGQVKAKLVAVTAARVLQEGTQVVYPSPQPPYVATSPTAPAVSTVLDPSSVVDLTSKVDASGMVHFSTSTPGHWIIFAFWQRPTAQKVMDHLRAQATTAATEYIDQHQIGPANLRSLIPGSYFFEDSLELTFNGVPWTEGFLSEFKRLRGYDLAPYAPALFIQDDYSVPGYSQGSQPNADYEFPGGIGARVRHDFLQTLTDLYRMNHLGGFARWARTHGMKFRAQPYTSFFDPSAASLTLASIGAGADTETLGGGDPSTPGSTTWRAAMDFYRIIVGGSDQGGGDEVSIELGAEATRDYMVSLSEYKGMMDKLWASGGTTPVIHGFAYQEPGAKWPGTDYMFNAVSQSWNQRWYPEWPLWRRLADYWSRGNMVLRAGRPLVDVAVYRDGQYAAPIVLFDGTNLEQAGYTYEFIGQNALEDPLAIGNGVLFQKAPSYRALVVHQTPMAGAAAQALARASARGLAVVVVGAPPSRGVSYSDAAQEDKQVKQAFRKILASPHTRVVSTDSEVLGALRSLGIVPGVSFSKPVTVWSRRRQTPKTDYWYLWNGGTLPVSFTASFRTIGVPRTLDLWTGAINRVAKYTTSPGEVNIPLALRPGETRVYAFARGSRQPVHVVASNVPVVRVSGRRFELDDVTGGGTRFARLSNGQYRQFAFAPLPAPISPTAWHLHVHRSQPESTNTDQDFQLTTLEDWRNIQGLQYSSGTGTYTTTVDVPSAWLSRSRGVELDLGTIWGSFQAYVNAKLATPQATTDQQFDASWLAVPPSIAPVDITRLLHPGTNQITVVLATTLKNAVVGEALKGNPAGGAGAAPTTQPYGLKGPVLLRPFDRVYLTARAGRRAHVRRASRRSTRASKPHSSPREG